MKEKQYFVLLRANCSNGVDNGVIGITDDEEFAKSQTGVFCFYQKVSFLTRDLTEKVKQIAETYHDRVVFAGMSGGEKVCGCCEKDVFHVVCIEHDSQNYSKDLWVCLECYNKIATYWENHSPKKICPI